LLMSGAWGLGPLDEVAAALARDGYWVLAVAGTNERLRRRLSNVAPTVRAFGYTDRIPDMMAASNVVVTSSGDTCREARVIGRALILLDVVPGHGRENLMHELELGAAAVCRPNAASVVGNVRRMIDVDPAPTMRDTWETDFVDALAEAGVELG
jgi:processive 1,2-diacylglycerol beta-glucosyltransferase